jgi:phosphoserine phosphatase
MKLFISHSNEDKALADALIEFFTNGIGLDHSQIFCSSSPGKGVPLGFNFNDYILKELKDEEVQVIALITNSYFNSKYCLYELGASWGLTRNTIPILGPRMKYAMMDGFLASTIAVSISKEEDIHKLVDDLKRKFDTKDVALERLMVSKRQLIQKVKLLDIEASSVRNAAKVTFAPQAKNYKYKLVAFDFDGPLLQSINPSFGDAFHYSWKEIWKFLGYDDKIRKELYYKHQNNPTSYTYQEWCDDCAAHFIKEKFHKNHIREIIAKQKLKLPEGLLTTLKCLKKAGLHLAIISGGIDTFFEETFDNEHKSLFTKYFFNKFEYTSEGYLKRIKAYQNKESDFVGKVDALKEVCKMVGCEISQAVFVGEGTNDIDAAKSAGLSIAYPPTATQDFKDIADVVSDDFNIATILSHILVPNELTSRKPNHYRKYR